MLSSHRFRGLVKQLLVYLAIIQPLIVCKSNQSVGLFLMSLKAVNYGLSFMCQVPRGCMLRA